MERSQRWALAHAKVARKRMGRWPRYVPLIDVAREYRRDDLPHDLVAGCVLGVVTVPQAIAYAFLAGLPAQAGLYACLLPMVLYAVFGSSRQLVVGPVAVAALMVAAALGEHAPAYSNRYAEIATILCLQVGILLWLLRAFQMGGIVNLLSHPVISGFINAAAVLLEVGGELQHGALLAREYGKPCVAGIVGLMDRLEDGQTVEVNGDQGVVRII